jgi:hypothetical protein
MKQVAIMAVAQNIDLEVIYRFQECIHKSDPSVTYDIHLLGANKKRGKNENFNKSMMLNKGIKKLVPMRYDVIVQCDIDLIIPPNVIDYTYEVAMKERVCCHCNHRRTDPEILPKLPEEYEKVNWDKLLKLKMEAANGCWNGIQSQYWYDTGGFNEEMIEWGREDDEWRRRSARVGKLPFNDTSKFPILHYNHPMRTKDMRKRNTQIENQCIKKGKTSWLD